MEEKETAPKIQRAIIGSMKGARNGNHPHPFAFGHAQFGQGLSLQSILSDQADIGCIKLLLRPMECQMESGAETPLS